MILRGFFVLILKNVETIKSFICNKLTQVSPVYDCTVEAHSPYSCTQIVSVWQQLNEMHHNLKQKLLQLAYLILF